MAGRLKDKKIDIVLNIEENPQSTSTLVASENEVSQTTVLLSPCEQLVESYVTLCDLVTASLELLTDIDINTYDDSTLGSPSVTSYRMNHDVLCIQPPSLRASESFRSTRDNTPNSTAKRNVPDTQCQYIKFRERSYSDIQHVERKPWRAVALSARHFE
ncbi:hypothetical protein NQ318_015253 [Aromia moschata]|uniref:Uncharacterized protein n=1 Tax=Aromia moschata TaxID=1265417 RepID=A0AAV8YGD3_9CUCU|nr:hypothetical protein NQ318_015253 [Aromia moschata]